MNEEKQHSLISLAICLVFVLALLGLQCCERLETSGGYGCERATIQHPEKP